MQPDGEDLSLRRGCAYAAVTSDPPFSIRGMSRVLIIVNSVEQGQPLSRVFSSIPKGCPLDLADSSEYPNKSLFPKFVVEAPATPC